MIPASPSERQDGATEGGHTSESACLNCGTPLIGTYCHACGQRAHIHRTLGAFFHDLLHGALHFEGKTWRTLPMLVARPGELTRRYIAGERARFVSPMALFLFSVFLVFAVFQFGSIAATDERPLPAQVSATGGTPEQQLAALREARAGLPDGNPASAVIDAQIAALERRIEETRDEDGRLILAENRERGGRLTFTPTGWAFLDRAITSGWENPSLMTYKLQANSYKFSWLLIPLSVPFVWLLFAWRRRFGPYDHAVFVTYSLSFMSLLFVTATLLARVPVVGGGWLLFATVPIPPLHIYKQLRGAYALSRFSALWRTMVLLIFVIIIMVLFLGLLLAIGAIS